MSKPIKIGCIRSTAIAVTNDLVAHLGLGRFMSQIDFEDNDPIRYNDRSGRITPIVLEGRTDYGEGVYARVNFAIDTAVAPDAFSPIEAEVHIRSSNSVETPDYLGCFICDLRKNGITFEALE